ncbi:MAG: DUF58 domain-containing protein, partial [Bdellovibrionales bacterium]|nr:DUF58 domain-containing protein [Bdellovibrionales bacterium]
MIPDIFTPSYLKSLELLKFKSRRAYLGLREGGHASIKRGHGIEFADYRKYELGDDPRHIDWGVYARSDRLYLKRFREERDLSLLLMLDATNSMFVPAEDSKWEYARDIALTLAYIALSQQDMVLASVPGEKISASFRGGNSFYEICRYFTKRENQFVEETDFLKGIVYSANAIKFPGAAIFISDFLFPFEKLEKSLLALRAKNLDITLIQVLGKNDLDPFENSNSYKFVDAETGEKINLSSSNENINQY